MGTGTLSQIGTQLITVPISVLDVQVVTYYVISLLISNRVTVPFHIYKTVPFRKICLQRLLKYFSRNWVLEVECSVRV